MGSFNLALTGDVDGWLPLCMPGTCPRRALGGGGYLPFFKYQVNSNSFVILPPLPPALVCRSTLAGSRKTLT